MNSHDGIRPPLGLMPKAEWDRQRVFDILDAMRRYAGEAKSIPLQWIDELRELQK